MPSKHVAIPTDLDAPPRPACHDIRSLGGETMGTGWFLRFAAESALSSDMLTARLEAQFNLIIAQMSPWEANSDITRFNRALAGEWITLPDEFSLVLNAALSVSEQSGGAFDPACGPLVNVWGFGPDGHLSTSPTNRAIEQARRRCGAHRLRRDGPRWILQRGGAELDLSSIAKGFAVDRAGAALDAMGVESWLIEIGGEFKGRGAKPNGEPWWVLVDDARTKAADEASFVVALSGAAVATSGQGVRFFSSGGQRFSHAIDPRTGHPVTHDLAAVTVIHNSAMMADAYATAILVLGPKAGLALAEMRNLATRLVCWNGDERVSTAMQAMLD